mmetsp:Transcript_34044/g.89375  ORF Transcript_34044/g.89375 Transcript_34044/m.89375 type:complete len:243 (+) Transcript_34044:1692-2420(+)
MPCSTARHCRRQGWRRKRWSLCRRGTPWWPARSSRSSSSFSSLAFRQPPCPPTIASKTRAPRISVQPTQSRAFRPRGIGTVHALRGASWCWRSGRSSLSASSLCLSSIGATCGWRSRTSTAVSAAAGPRSHRRRATQNTATADRRRRAHGSERPSFQACSTGKGKSSRPGKLRGVKWSSKTASQKVRSGRCGPGGGTASPWPSKCSNEAVLKSPGRSPQSTSRHFSAQTPSSQKYSAKSAAR